MSARRPECRSTGSRRRAPRRSLTSSSRTHKYPEPESLKTRYGLTLRSPIRRDEAGSGTVVSFIVAVSVFILAFAVVTIFLSTQVQLDAENKDESIDLAARANGAVRQITTSPGYPSDWHEKTPDQDPLRFGLLKSGTTSTLDLEKFRALNRDLNSHAWYSGKARALLGLDNYEFHIRAHPILKTDANGNVPELAPYRVAYVGQHTGSYGSGYTQVAGTTGRDAGLLTDAAVTFTDAVADMNGNTDGFDAGDTFPTDVEPLSRHLALRLAGFPHAYNVTQKSGVNDTYWKVVSLQDFPEGTAPYIPSSARPDNVVTMSNRDWVSGSENWTASQGVAGSEDADRLILGPYDFSESAGGSIWLNVSHHVYGKNSSGASTDFARLQVCFDGCLTGGAWISVAEWSERGIRGSTANFWQDDSLSLSGLLGENEAFIGFAWDPGTSTDQTRRGWFLKNLSINATTSSGVSQVYVNKLDYRTSEYDALVIGSAAEQSAFADSFTGYVFKHALKNWVKAGGDVLALGSDDLDNRWLAPTFTEGDNPGAAGPLLESESDLTHPILTVPHNLRYLTYSPYDSSSYDASNLFTKIILAREAGGSGQVPLLAVSNPNSEWDGTLVLTSYAPSPNNIPSADDEDHHFFVNMLSFMRYNVLYVDWGGTIPKGAPVGSGSRTMLVDGDAEGLGRPEESIVIYVWR